MPQGTLKVNLSAAVNQPIVSSGLRESQQLLLVVDNVNRKILVNDRD
ncbi:MAG: hypothetical protein QW839_04745 [Conexivisphaerales archaeon]